MLRLVSFASVLTAALALAPLAHADVAADAAASATVFREARALMEQGRIAAACDKFEAANKLLPTPGTLLSLADCREKNGQTATAYGAFQEAGILARQKGDEDRDAEAKRRAALLEPLPSTSPRPRGSGWPTGVRARSRQPEGSTAGAPTWTASSATARLTLVPRPGSS
jgi:tetratricopeptide (TPR) repeat protein